MRYLFAIYQMLIVGISLNAQGSDPDVAFTNQSFFTNQETLDLETNFFAVSTADQNAIKHTSTWVNQDRERFGNSSNLIERPIMEPFLNLRSKFYQDKILIVTYSGSQAAFCYVTDDTGRTVHRYAGLMGKEPALMNIDYLPQGRYFLNVEVGGKLYQRTFYREEILDFEEDDR